MQPNKAATPWGAMATIVTVAIALTVVYLGVVVASALPGSGFGLGNTLDDHACLTITADELDVDDTTFSQPDQDGVRRATTREDVCRSLDEFDHPSAVRALSAGTNAPLTIGVLVILLGMRRIIQRTRDEGPFTSATVERLNRFRWWAALTIMLAVTVRWILDGVLGDLLIDKTWGSTDMLWPPLGVFLVITLAARACEVGARQRQAAYEQGRADAAASLD